MASPASITLEGHVSSDQALSYRMLLSSDQALSYRMLPFTVPADTGRIEVSYACQSDLSFGLHVDENPQDYVADIALFDPRGAEFMGQGFRGTSGNSRPSIFVAPDDATPGYMPGTIQSGEWQIMLGFYKVAPTGCDYSVTIRTLPGDAQSHSLALKRLPVRTTSDRPANPLGWYVGELHCHTFHSDGAADPREVVAMAEKHGLDFLSITDHNVFTQQIVMNQIETDLILIPGCEVTTQHGHWNIWGDAGWIDFRVNSAAEMETAIHAAVEQGYLTSCNHPRPEGPPWRFTDAEGYACVEVWNSPWELLNDTCLNFWVTRLNQGKRLVAVGGSDSHHMDERHDERVGYPANHIYSPGAPSAAALLAALRLGHNFVSYGPLGPELYLASGTTMMGDAVPTPASGLLTIDVHVVGGSGGRLEIHTARGLAAAQIVGEDDLTLEFDIPVKDALYVRAQLRDPQTEYMLAITNPIYLDPA